jgi:hypothetical protein
MTKRNDTQELAKEQMKIQLKNFKQSADAIVDLWFSLHQDDQDQMGECYPFPDDFAEIAERIHLWMEKQNENN